MALEQEFSTWKLFHKSLHSSRRVFGELFDLARNNCAAASAAVRPSIFEGMTMAIVLALAVEIEEIANQIEELNLKRVKKDG